MEEQKLTLRQQIAYARWSAKFAFDFPWVGWFWVLVAGIIYLGLVFWFFEPELNSFMRASAPHALGKRYFLGIFAVVALVALSYVTVYIPFFIISLFDKDEVMRKHFLKYYYRKH